jgi:hypothetical protein
VKQLNIFGAIDHLNEDGEIKRCEVCKNSIEKGQICSKECGEIWIKENIDNGLKCTKRK